MTTVFVSYSSRDINLATRIARDLASHGLDVWIDEWKIAAGDSITQEIERGVLESDFVAVLLSRHSVVSGWVQKEWQAKIGVEAAERRVAVIPLKAEACDVPGLLRDKRYADFSQDYSLGLNALLSALHKHTTKADLRLSQTRNWPNILDLAQNTIALAGLNLFGLTRDSSHLTQLRTFLSKESRCVQILLMDPRNRPSIEVWCREFGSSRFRHDLMESARTLCFWTKTAQQERWPGRLEVRLTGLITSGVTFLDPESPEGLLLLRTLDTMGSIDVDPFVLTRRGAPEKFAAHWAGYCTRFAHSALLSEIEP